MPLRPVKHLLELHFDRVLTEREWREVVVAARQVPYVVRLRAYATHPAATAGEDELQLQRE